MVRCLGNLEDPMAIAPKDELKNGSAIVLEISQHEITVVRRYNQNCSFLPWESLGHSKMPLANYPC
jgi:hypothetical protein